MPNYGVIDLGSNSVRLCVYEVKDDTKKHYTKKDFRTLLNNKAMAGLSAHVVDGVFTDNGIKHAIDVLHGHNKRLKYFNCVRTDTFATAVLRNASNSAQVIKTIEEETGFAIALLSAKDEAHLGFVGAISDQRLESGTLVDIGGGSTELTRIRMSQDFDNTSIAQGSLSSYASYVKAILPSAKEMRSISQALEKKFYRLDSPYDYAHETFFGIGGSLRAAAKVYAEIFNTEKRPEIMKADFFDELISFSLNHPDKFAHLALMAAPDRIHTVIPGCLIVRTLMDLNGAKNLTICKNGLREGYLIERMLLDNKTNGVKKK